MHLEPLGARAEQRRGVEQTAANMFGIVGRCGSEHFLIGLVFARASRTQVQQYRSKVETRKVESCVTAAPKPNEVPHKTEHRDPCRIGRRPLCLRLEIEIARGLQKYARLENLQGGTRLVHF